MKASKGVLQTGSQQRSDPRFRLACELVSNGRIGKLRHVTVILSSGLRGGPSATAPVPAGLDWNTWQGQVQAKDFVPERGHKKFRYWLDYWFPNQNRQYSSPCPPRYPSPPAAARENFTSLIGHPCGLPFPGSQNRA